MASRLITPVLEEIQDVNKDLESIDASEIKQIEHTGTTGGKDGDYSYYFSDKEVVEFIDLLNQVKLGDMGTLWIQEIRTGQTPAGS